MRVGEKILPPIRPRLEDNVMVHSCRRNGAEMRRWDGKACAMYSRRERGWSGKPSLGFTSLRIVSSAWVFVFGGNRCGLEL